MSGAMRVGSATFMRLRLNFWNRPISLLCVAEDWSYASFIKRCVFSNSPYELTVSVNSLTIASKLRLFHHLLLFYPSTGAARFGLTKPYSTRFFTEIFLLGYVFDSRYTFFLLPKEKAWLGIVSYDNKRVSPNSRCFCSLHGQRNNLELSVSITTYRLSN